MPKTTIVIDMPDLADVASGLEEPNFAITVTHANYAECDCGGNHPSKNGVKRYLLDGGVSLLSIVQFTRSLQDMQNALSRAGERG